MLTTFDADDRWCARCAPAPAGFLLKDTPPADIVRAIERVAAGEPMLSPAIMQRLIAQVTDDPAAERRRRRRGRCWPSSRSASARSPVAVAEGKSNAEIGAGAAPQRRDA